MKTKGRCGELWNAPGMFVKTRDLSVDWLYSIENTCSYTHPWAALDSTFRSPKSSIRMSIAAG
jgi:hypothetical protein